MSVLALLFGSVGLLLYGTQLTAEGLQRIAGERLRWLLTSLARNRLFALASGNSPPISTHPLLSSLMPQPDNAMRKEPLTGFLTGFLMRF